MQIAFDVGLLIALNISMEKVNQTVNIFMIVNICILECFLSIFQIPSGRTCIR